MQLKKISGFWQIIPCCPHNSPNFEQNLTLSTFAAAAATAAATVVKIVVGVGGVVVVVVGGGVGVVVAVC